MKRILAVFLVLVMAMCCLPAAMAEDSAPVKGTALFPTNEKGYPDLGGVTITIWIPFDSNFTDIATSYDEWAIIKELEARFNVNLEFLHPPVGQERENFTLMMTNEKLPDIIFKGGIESYYPGGVTMAYEEGVLVDYTSLISPENTPNYWAKVMDDDYLSKGAIDDAGRNFRLGDMVAGSAESCTTMWGLMIREDFLQATGLAVPETIDEWDTMLRAMKANGVEYPLLLNKSNYWQTRNAFSAAWNISARDFYIREDGTVGYGPTEPQYKEYLATMNKWYADGLINPDFMNQTQADTWSMLANNQGGSVVDHTWGYAANYYQVVEVSDPSRRLVAAQLPRLSKDAPLSRVMVTNRGLDKSNAKYITADTEHLEECVAFLDALYLDDIEFMMSNGIEGIGYVLNDYGYPVIQTMTQDSSTEDRLSQRIWEFETESDSDLDYIMTSKYCYGVQPECITLLVQNSYDGIWPFGATFTVEESEVLSKYKADVDTYRDEMVLKFVTGAESLDNFDAFVEKINSMGLSEMLKVYESSYARFLTR